MNELPELYNDKKVKARKAHKCNCCGCEIFKGDDYVSITGKWCGEFESFKQCLSCSNVFYTWRELRPGGEEYDGPAFDQGGIKQWLIEHEVTPEELCEVSGVNEHYARIVTGGEL